MATLSPRITMVAMAATSISATCHPLFTNTRSISRLQLPLHPSSADQQKQATVQALHLATTKKQFTVRASSAAGTTTSEAATMKKRSSYEIETLTGWLLKQEQAGNIDPELTIVLSSISMACKQIASLVQLAGISNLTGVQGAVNVQGEDQKKLDVVSNEVFSNCLRSSGRTGIIASEEEDVPVAVEESYSGNYIVVFDPLDGSSNIDAAVSTGSIFGIYSPTMSVLQMWEMIQRHKVVPNKTECSLAAWRGTRKVCRQCVPTRIEPTGCRVLHVFKLNHLVLSIGKGVFAFTLDPLYGEFVLTQENIKIPKAGKIYSFNEGNYLLWDDKLKKYMDHLKDPGPAGKPYSARYIGSLVGDFHRTLLYGGIYGYPRDKKSKNGKLRLLYECAPMSFIVEQADGEGSDGHRRVLDIKPEEIHQRVPLFIGSVEEIEKLETFLA